MGYINSKFLAQSALKLFLDNNRARLLKHNYAIEREMLRVVDFKNSTYKHPEVFGKKTQNMYITTDFAENQIEVITKQHKSIQEAIDFSEALYDIVASELKTEEVLWPLSMPCDINSKITEACFTEEKQNELYRKYLTTKYGKHRQMISGIHFNFSFDEELLKDMQEFVGFTGTFKQFKNEVYLKTVNNYLYYQYLIVVFLSATPVADVSFGKTNNVYSIRNSEYGYHNLENLGIEYSSITDFIKSVKRAIDNQLIIDEREIYESIRIKNGQKYVCEKLEETGIRYIEIRNIDINPYTKSGIDVNSLLFLEVLLVFCLYSDYTDKKNIAIDVANSTNVFEFSNVILEDLHKIKAFCKQFNLSACEVIDTFIEQVHTQSTLSLKIKEEVQKLGFREFGYKYANKYLRDSYNNRYKFCGYEDLELSTQLLIREAIKNGVEVDILDRFDNFIKLTKNNRVELVKQATKTSKDGFVNILAMENKVVTKNILRNNNIVVPNGSEFTKLREALDYAKNMNGDFVIKPKSTNFGVGISIFKESVEETVIVKALKHAFNYDDTILIEKFIKGQEYRFLVIDNCVCGVLNRIPANVIGDGKKTIKELIDVKNQDSLRGTGYSKPLEKIKVDDVCLEFLRQQNLTVDSIIQKDEIVYLRENSNISTGGDSIDYTDLVHPHFKDLAIESTRAFDVVFCGVDIIIEDISNPKSDYGVIEVNFNPAIHIHSFPYKGEERNIVKSILRALKLV